MEERTEAYPSGLKDELYKKIHMNQINGILTTLIHEETQEQYSKYYCTQVPQINPGRHGFHADETSLPLIFNTQQPYIRMYTNQIRC